jgi:hypothetical protein
MKINFFLIVIFFISFQLKAQVGIGSTNPKSLLEIKSSNPANPSNKDGLLIPKLDNFPTTDPEADQDGMLIYRTTDKTIYKWDNADVTWVPLVMGSSVEMINDLSDAQNNDTENNLFLGHSGFLGTFYN